MKQIYNEGRVVGLSQYELYVRQLLATNPTATPLSESEWLKTTLSCNCSMILKLPSGTTAGAHDYILPEGSDLCGCTVIYASLFEGSITTDTDDIWAIRVDDNGRLVSSTYGRHPETPGEPEDVPAKEHPTIMPNEFVQQILNFSKITGGLMFQPGTWLPLLEDLYWLAESGDNITDEDGEDILVPEPIEGASMAVTPDLSKRGFLRFVIESDLDCDVYVFLHGFAYKSKVAGISGLNDSTGNSNPQDGDFLGPALFPWACKIMLMITTDIFKVYMDNINSSIQSLNERITAIENGQGD